MLLSQLCIRAQGPTLTAASAPHIGDNFILQNIRSIGLVAGPAGANQTWDYSAVIDTGAAYVESIISAAASAAASSYPSASLALTYSANPDTVNGYERLSGDSLTYLGTFISGLSTLTYTTPRLLFKYPFSYTDAYANDFAGLSDNGDTITGIDSVVADGYGTLKLPGQTFTNVLRYKLTQHTHQVTSFGFSQDIYQVEYDYYIPGYHNYLFTLAFTTTYINGNAYSGVSGQYAKSVNTGIDDLKTDMSLSVYPNPSSGIFTIDISDAELIGAGVTICDLMGKKVMETKLTESKQLINLNGAAKGLYILSINKDGKTLSKKLSVE
jgi:hypothetical protein